ncbi:g972 [Coccomyxa viridis]|uniref:G972 protein n=1 Tax=Coccomyxa viridis TaxID=1274662 RepID=A0ABP1FJW6_9CHLO
MRPSLPADDLEDLHFNHLLCFQCLNSHDLFRDTVYGPVEWRKHKSWRRHFPEGFVCLQVLAWYWPPVLFVIFVGVLVGLYHTYLQPLGAPDITRDDYTQPFTLTSFALALLLVFRTNSSYDRWWEARRMWGQLLNITRNLVRQTYAWGDPADGPMKERIARWTIAIVYALKMHLRRSKRAPNELLDVLLPHEIEWLEKQQHRPNAATQVLTEAVKALRVSDYQRVMIDSEITNFHLNLAACERLFSQPIPVAYTRHTSRFLLTWTSFLPFALYSRFQWLTPFVSAIITFLLFGVENIGVQIEQPFEVLPLPHFCAAIKKHILDMVACHAEAKALALQSSMTPSPSQMALHSEDDARELVIEMQRRTSLDPRGKAM